MRKREYERSELDQLVTPGLGLGFDDVVIHEPGLELRIRPGVVNLIRRIVIVFVHLRDKVIAVLLIVRLDQPLAKEPPMLHAS